VRKADLRRRSLQSQSPVRAAQTPHLKRNTHTDLHAAANRVSAPGSNIRQDLESALALHQRGQLAEAEQMYRDILKRSADNFDALHLLGTVLLQRGRTVDGEQLIARALKIKPNDPYAHNNRGNALRDLRRIEEALASYDQAIALQVDYAEAFNNRGITLHDLKRFDEAVASYDQAIALKPNYAEAFNNRGVTLHELKRFNEALASYQKAIALRPNYAEAFNNLGNMLKDLKRFDDALSNYDKAIALRPDYAEALYNRGNVLKESSRLEEAIASYNQAIAAKPNAAEVYNNRGNVLKTLNRFDEALASYEQAIALQPGPSNLAVVLNNRGLVLHEFRRFEDEIASYNEAIVIRDDYPEPVANRGLIQLLLGEYQSGWVDYELRWKIANFPSRRPAELDAPIWHGEDLSDRHLLVYAEQGLGDTIQFSRYFQRLTERNCRATFIAPAPLVSLLQSSFSKLRILEDVADLKEVGDVDFQLPLLSLPHRFGTELSSIPNTTPYLKAKPERQAYWAHRVESKDFKIGLVWSGNPKQKDDARRSIELRAMLGLLHVDAAFISLQKEVRAADAALLKDRKDILHFGEQQKDFSDTAAIISHLDLVISVDTSVAHLAGALGKPVWVLLPFVPDWRWLLEREDSPWYPTARLFRQPQRGDWAAVLAKVKHELSSLAGGKKTKTSQRLKMNLPINAGVQASSVPASGTNIAAELQKALVLHQVGEFSKAEQIYRDILELDPDNFDARHLLGVAAHQQGKNVEALGLINEALKEIHSRKKASRRSSKRVDKRRTNAQQIEIELERYAAAFNNRGVVLKELRRFDKSLASYDEAIALQPNYADAFNNRGVVLRELDRLEEAVTSYDNAISIKQDYTEALFNRGTAFADLKRYDEALASYDRALGLRPSYAEALFNRGYVLQELGRAKEALANYDQAIALRPDNAVAFYNRGTALQKLGRLEEALKSYEQAIVLKPGYAEALNNRGLVFRELNQIEEALANFNEAITQKPNYVKAINNQGTILQELGRFNEALAGYRAAIALEPANAETYYNQAVTFQALKRFDEAFASYEKALALKPNNPDVQLSEALCRLLVGDFDRAWEKHEWRWLSKQQQNARRNFTQPQWKGEQDIAGKVVLLHAEQGLGDTIQFCRYAPLLAERGATIALEVQNPLHELMSTLKGPVQIVPKGGQLPDFDLHCPLLSLPLAFRTRLETIPSTTPYLQAPTRAVQRWEPILGGRDRIRVGLCWAGDPNFKGDLGRSIGLRALIPLLENSNVEFFSLQKDLRPGDAGILFNNPRISHLGDRVETFSDTAAIVSMMDLVISSDTSIVHLAGALGKPVWILLQFLPDWRWLLDLDDSPWYPTARLFRQDQSREWSKVIAQVSAALAELVAKAHEWPKQH
jgi:tetratricopeptide (TPR) repeat protein